MSDIVSKKFNFTLLNRLVLFVFMLAFIAGCYCVWQSIITTKNKLVENAYEIALNEQFRIGYTIKKMAENYNYSEEDKKYYLTGAIKNAADSYAEYYTADASYRIVSEDIGSIFSNIPDERILLLDLLPKTDGTVSYVMKQSGGRTLVFVSSYIKIYQNLFRLDYIQDITSVTETLSDLAKSSARTLFIVDLALLIALFFIIKRSLTPLKNLKDQALAIERGDYDLRAEVFHNDEVGQLAASFNNMASAVQEHVNTLSEAARLKELFASNLAHEIRTPLTSIIAYSDYAARKDVKKAELQGILEYIKAEGARMAELSNKVLKWSSINHYEADIKPCRPQRVIEQVMYTLKHTAEKNNLCINVENSAAIFYADEALLISMLVNLCKNAMNASDKGNNINVIINNDSAGSLIIKVIDKGIGIEKDELKRITEPFYMVDKARDRSKGGAGLGLTLCDAIIKAHDGQMIIESVYGEGTSVSVIIPQPNNLQFRDKSMTI